MYGEGFPNLKEAEATFLKQTSNEGAAGNRYEWTSYRNNFV